MAEKEKRKFTVINNTDIQELERQSRDTIPPSDIKSYQTNPMYEKLLNFKELQKKKRFTVEDLLKW